MSSNQHPCKNCSFVAKNAGGLTSHMRKHERETVEAPVMKEKVIPMTMPKPRVAKAQVEPEHKVQPSGICRSCHALPIGSVEVVSLLLVLIFSLTAVLLTSIYALEIQGGQIDELEARLDV